MSRRQSQIFTTADEAQFIDNLGRQSEEGRISGPLKAVEGYLKGAQKRTDWGLINRQAAIDYATSRLRELRRNPAEAIGRGKTFKRGLR